MTENEKLADELNRTVISSGGDCVISKDLCARIYAALRSSAPVADDVAEGRDLWRESERIASKQHDKREAQNAALQARIAELEADNERFRAALEDIGIYGCGMLNQPAALNGSPLGWAEDRIFQMETAARAALKGESDA